jgi:hypothetical protein
MRSHASQETVSKVQIWWVPNINPRVNELACKGGGIVT